MAHIAKCMVDGDDARVSNYIERSSTSMFTTPHRANELVCFVLDILDLTTRNITLA